jgi:hypothetical protein
MHCQSNNILQLIFNQVSCLYQERRILLISKQKSLLFHAAQSLVTLIYPLWWNYTYIPVLPELLINFITNDRPYILGFPSTSLNFLDSFCSDILSAGIHPDFLVREEVKSVIGKVVFANLDENTVAIPPGVAEPPDKEVSSYFDIFSHFVTHFLQFLQLMKAMDHILATNLGDMDAVSCVPSNEPPRIENFDEAIKTAFLSFFLSLFGDFRKFLLFLVVKPKPLTYLDIHKMTHSYLQKEEGESKKSDDVIEDSRVRNK